MFDKENLLHSSLSPRIHKFYFNKENSLGNCETMLLI